MADIGSIWGRLIRFGLANLIDAIEFRSIAAMINANRVALVQIATISILLPKYI